MLYFHLVRPSCQMGEKEQKAQVFRPFLKAYFVKLEHVSLKRGIGLGLVLADIVRDIITDMHQIDFQS